MDIDRMINSINNSIPSECGECDLARYCATQKYSDSNPIVEPTTSIEMEAEQILQAVLEGEKHTERARAYQDWRERLELRYVGEPEKLRTALEYVDSMERDLFAMEFTNEINQQEFIDRTKSEEAKQRDKIEAIDAALDMRDEKGCSGPKEVKVGRFLSRRTVKICGLEDTPEFTRVRKLYDEDLAFVQAYYDKNEPQ